MQIQKRHFAEIIAEFLGTFVLVSVILISSMVAPSAAGFTIGLALAALILALSKYSFAHFNPIVTIGHFISTSISNLKISLPSIVRLVTYLVTQLLASVAAALLLSFISSQLKAFVGDVTLGNNILKDPKTKETLVLLGFIVEMLFSFIFVLVILVSTTNKKIKAFAGIPIGLMLLVLTMLATGITGASFHPYRSLVTAFGSDATKSVLWVYLLAPTLGGILAGITTGGLNLLVTPVIRTKKANIAKNPKKVQKKKKSSKTKSSKKK